LTAEQFDVVTSSTVIYINQYDQEVYENFSVLAGSSTSLKFLTQVPTGANWTVTWGAFEDGTVQAAKFMDWYSANATGLGYIPYIITGYDLGASQGGDRKLQGNYITILMKRTEIGIETDGTPINTSSINLQTRWNFADNAVSNKWGNETQVYRHRRVFIPASLPSPDFVNGFPVLIAKHKMRGRGNAFQLKFFGEEGKDFQLIGWSIPVLSNVD
jgi:hypothetical protein